MAPGSGALAGPAPQQINLTVTELVAADGHPYLRDVHLQRAAPAAVQPATDGRHNLSRTR